MKIYRVYYDCHGTIKRTKVKALTVRGAKRSFRRKYPSFMEIMGVEKVDNDN